MRKIAFAVLLSAASVAGLRSEIRFREHVLATGLKGGYQVVVADLNHDGRPDLIALASGLTELAWYENPGPAKDPAAGPAPWTRHVLAANLPHLINCAAQDTAGGTNGDGIPEIVVAWEFANDAAKSVGKVGVLHHQGDPRELWKLTEIDQLPTSHRIRWADLDGTGRKVAVNAVLTGSKAAPPLYEGRAPLVFYRPGLWKREVLSEALGEANQGVQHGILITRWAPNDKRESILTASFSGIDLFRWAEGAWTRTEISRGDASPCPKCGSSDVAVGHLRNGRFLAAIEPWHGNQVAVYLEKGSEWVRTTIDDSLVDGHTVLAADFDGDGNDELVGGFRQGAKAVYLYQLVGKAWVRQTVEEGLGSASCAAADLRGSGTVDLVCIGSAGAALKWFENVSTRKVSPGR